MFGLQGEGVFNRRGVGLLLSLSFWRTWGGFGGYRRVTYVREDPYDRRY